MYAHSSVGRGNLGHSVPIEISPTLRQILETLLSGSRYQSEEMKILIITSGNKTHNLLRLE